MMPAGELTAYCTWMLKGDRRRLGLGEEAAVDGDALQVSDDQREDEAREEEEASPKSNGIAKM